MFRSYFARQWRAAGRFDKALLLVAWAATPYFLILCFTPLTAPVWIFLAVAALMLTGTARNWILLERDMRRWRRERDEFDYILKRLEAEERED